MATEPRIAQSYEVPITGSVSTNSSNAIGSSGATAVLSANPSLRKLIFHNPNYDPTTGGVDLLIAQSSTPTFAAPGGGFILLAGATQEFGGDAAQGPWYATARSGSGKGITIVTSMK